MHCDDLAVYSVVGLVVILMLATGPHLPLLSIPEGGFGSDGAIGEGHAQLDVIDPPDQATLEPADYADTHHLRVPETSATISNVEGTPLLTVSINIDDLGYSRSSVFTLREHTIGTRSYGIEDGSIESDRLHEHTYEGTIRFVLRDDNGRSVLFESPITIEVTE